MKKIAIDMISLFATGIFLVCSTASFAAAPIRASARDLNTLAAGILLLNQNASLPEADMIIKKKLSDNYNLTLGKIDGLLGKNMQYGDLAAILAFANNMRGGVSDANINKLVDLRQSKAGWDKMAKDLNVDLSRIARSVSRFEDDTHSSIKKALAESTVSGAAAGGQ